MGEVYLGLQEGIGGLERLVVVKRIFSRLGDDEHFTQLLLEEARLVASIHHPNVVQILDIARDDDGYFLVLEYLSGETLGFVARTLRERGERIPPAIACRFAGEVAAGLHCAHTASDPVGGPQPIVHRDVTPSNLILCFNGVVKIVDFGVAKALSAGHTRGGLKGKMSYLAPEQLYDQPVDGRTDVFQLGICLHELLTGERLFTGDDDRERANSILEKPIEPPSALVPSLPRVLDEVVLWALERDPDRRPESADDLRCALEVAAAELGPISRHDLGTWMSTTFADRLTARTQFERRCVAEMREGRALGDSPSLRPATVPLAPGQESRSSVSPMRTSTFLMTQASSSDSHSEPGRSDPRSGSGWGAPPASRTSWIALALALLACTLVAGSAIAWNLRQSPADRATVPPVSALPVEPPAPAPRASSPASTRTFDVDLDVSPPTAVIEIDGFEVGRGSYRVALPMDGARHRLTVRARGYQSVELDFADQPPPARVELRRVKAAPDRRARAKRGARRSSRRSRAMTDNPDPWGDDARRTQ